MIFLGRPQSQKVTLVTRVNDLSVETCMTEGGRAPQPLQPRNYRCNSIRYRPGPMAWDLFMGMLCIFSQNFSMFLRGEIWSSSPGRGFFSQEIIALGYSPYRSTRLRRRRLYRTSELSSSIEYRNGGIWCSPRVAPVF